MTNNAQSLNAAHVAMQLTLWALYLFCWLALAALIVLITLSSTTKVSAVLHLHAEVTQLVACRSHVAEVNAGA